MQNLYGFYKKSRHENECPAFSLRKEPRKLCLMRPASVLIYSILSGCYALALATADFSVSPTGNATRPGEGPNLAGNERRNLLAIGDSELGRPFGIEAARPPGLD